MSGAPRPGSGARLLMTSMGHAYSVDSPGATYLHPFRPVLVGSSVQLALGLVENRQPTINDVPIGGRNGLIPKLRLEPGIANADGESWVCVEVHPDADGLLPAESKIEIVHTRAPRSTDPDLGRGELCMILWRNRAPFRVLAIAMFNLRYERVLPPEGAGSVRHLFL